MEMPTDRPPLVDYRVVTWGETGQDSFYNVVRVSEGPNYLTLHHSDGELTLLSARHYQRVRLIPQYDREAMQ